MTGQKISNITISQALNSNQRGIGLLLRKTGFWEYARFLMINFRPFVRVMPYQKNNMLSRIFFIGKIGFFELI